DAFPGSGRWAAPRIGCRWWRAALGCPGAETWLTEIAARPVGLLLLVADEREWARWVALRQPRTVDVIAAAPWLVPAVVHRIKREIVSLSSDRGTLAGEREGVDGRPRLWLELLAVDPSVRRQGIGARLLKHADERAMALRRKYIRLLVERGNVAARTLY